MAKGQSIGYVRVSSANQNEARQLEALEGLDIDRMFVDKASGRDRSRPQLEALLAHVRDGDTVYVHSLDRLARSLVDLRDLVDELTGKRVSIQFVKEGLSFSGGSDSATSVLMLNMLGSFAEFERSLIKERQREGIAIAKAEGKYKGRKKALTDSQVKELQSEHRDGIGVSELSRKYGVSRQTVYSYLDANV